MKDLHNRQTKLTQLIRKQREAGNIALIPFVTAGVTGKKEFWDLLEELAANGADVIEIGVPFSDPVADGPIVAEASIAALEDGVCLDYILEGLRQHRHRFADTGIVLMGYANPFLQYGWPVSQGRDRLAGIKEAIGSSLDKLAADFRSAGVDGLIVPDIPYEEQHGWIKALNPEGVHLIPLVGLNTDETRMRRYAAEASGYVYVVSVLGTTGVRDSFPPELQAAMARARACFNLPLALGFGLHHPRQLADMPASAMPDAVVFGSALITHLKSGGSVKDFLQPWRLH